jgi:glycosyltransferase involved in cell wall biosynthesis
LRRRVLNVIETLGFGGAERLLETTHRHLDRIRFEPEVACLFGPNPLAEELRRMGVQVHELRLSGPHDLVRGILQLRQLIRKERFGIVHTHLYYANLVGRLAAWGQAEVVTTLHNPDYTYEDSGSLVFRVKKLLDRLTANWINKRLLAVSEDVRKDFERQMRFSGIRVIPNYIDVDAFSWRLERSDRQAVRGRWGLRDDDVMILHVGRSHPQKGQDVLIDAFAKARRERPGLVLFLVGQGKVREALAQRAEAAGVSQAVRFENSSKDVTPYYRAADLFVFPSRYEAFGIVLLEAMTAGLAIVASRVGGIPEVTGEETALLVPAGDVGALADAILSLAGDPVWRSSRGAAGRERAKAFDVRLHLQCLENVYASL